MPVREALPWWNEGLRFACLGCGRCCRWSPGAVFFSGEEGRAVVEFLDIDPSDFRRRFVTMRWGSPSFTERSDGHCVFYDAGSARCLIYAVRPEQCRSFPFWPELLQSRAAWDTEARRCPGMNEGPLRSAEEIEEWITSARNWLSVRKSSR